MTLYKNVFTKGHKPIDKAYTACSCGFTPKSSKVFGRQQEIRDHKIEIKESDRGIQD